MLAAHMSTPTRRFHFPSAIRSSPVRIEPDVARERVAAGALLIDVRRQDDPDPAAGAELRVPPDEIPERLSGFRRDVPIVLACT
jgi:rhodanese-related sulfurtransferase